MRILVALLTLAALATPASAVAKPSPGSAGLGDRLFPKLGNGGYDARHYDLALSYRTAAPEQSVPGVVRMRAVATQALSRFDLDYAGDAVAGVWVDGRRAAFRRDGKELVITPARPIRDGDSFDAAVAFRGHPSPPPADPTGENPTDPYAIGWLTTPGGSFTSPQPDRAEDIFPVNDHPSDKATYDVTVVAPRGVNVGVGGEQTGRRDAGDKTIWTFAMRQPLASQVLQVAVGTDLDTIRRGTVDGVQLRDLVAHRKAAIDEPTLSETPAQLRWMRERAGRYPFATYGILAVDQFFFYALETQTLSLHPADLFDPDQYPQEFAREIMLHELSHQWFGDSVSIGSWSDIWLSEGHATWYEQEYIAETQAANFEQFMRDEYAAGDQLRADFGPVARPKGKDANPDSPFSDNVYGGGALVLYALRQRIGDRAFRALQRDWAQQFGGRSATTADWIAFVDRSTHRDLTRFLRDWLYGTKTPPMPGHPDWTTAPPSAGAAAKGLALGARPFARSFVP
jgi:aminopeptidase N